MADPGYPAYPAARASAERVRAQFSRQHEAARMQGISSLAPEPDAEAIEAITDVAFWASLRHEEGRSPKISLAFLPPSATTQPLLFERQLPLSAAGLSKLAPAVERPGIHLGVWRDRGGEFRVWGTARHLPSLCFVVEVVTSGLLVVKHRGAAFGKFENVAVLEGDQIKFVGRAAEDAPDTPELVPSRLGIELPPRLAASVQTLVQLSASMRAHGRGGALIIVPPNTSSWEESVVQPVLYAVAPPYAELAELVADEERRAADDDWQQDVRRAVDALAGLTAVDGATVINERFELLAFGTKIARRRGSPQVERVLLTETVDGSARVPGAPYQLGGTRHLSAAQFVHDQREATVLVASQDGRFTIFRWSPPEDMVRAHRVEALLM
jgi:hypothetical protein